MAQWSPDDHSKRSEDWLDCGSDRASNPRRRRCKGEVAKYQDHGTLTEFPDLFTLRIAKKTPPGRVCHSKWNMQSVLLLKPAGVIEDVLNNFGGWLKQRRVQFDFGR